MRKQTFSRARSDPCPRPFQECRHLRANFVAHLPSFDVNSSANEDSAPAHADTRSVLESVSRQLAALHPDCADPGAVLRKNSEAAQKAITRPKLASGRASPKLSSASGAFFTPGSHAVTSASSVLSGISEILRRNAELEKSSMAGSLSSSLDREESLDVDPTVSLLAPDPIARPTSRMDFSAQPPPPSDPGSPVGAAPVHSVTLRTSSTEPVLVTMDGSSSPNLSATRLDPPTKLPAWRVPSFLIEQTETPDGEKDLYPGSASEEEMGLSDDDVEPIGDAFELDRQRKERARSNRESEESSRASTPCDSARTTRTLVAEDVREELEALSPSPVPSEDASSGRLSSASNRSAVSAAGADDSDLEQAVERAVEEDRRARETLARRRRERMGVAQESERLDSVDDAMESFYPMSDEVAAVKADGEEKKEEEEEREADAEQAEVSVSQA